MKRINHNLTENQIKRLKTLSKKIGLSASEILRRAFDEYSVGINGLKQPLINGDRIKMSSSKENTFKKIRKFRKNRLQQNVDRIAKDLFDVDDVKLSGPMVVLHCVPIADLSKPEKIVDFSDFRSVASKLLPGYMNVKSRYGSDGLTINSNDSYCKLMNVGGKLEYASVLFSDTEAKPYWIDIRKLEGFIIELVKNYISVLTKLDINPPIVILLSIVKASGSKLLVSDEIFNDRKRYLGEIEGKIIDTNELLIQEIEINDFAADMEKELHPIFNIIWNACGYPGSLLYDENENRID